MGTFTFSRGKISKKILPQKTQHFQTGEITEKMNHRRDWPKKNNRKFLVACLNPDGFAFLVF